MRIPFFIASVLLTGFVQAQTVVKKFTIPAGLTEISGMVACNGGWLVHGDGGAPPAMFVINDKGNVTDTFNIAAVNNDWEDLAENNNNYFIGDFGNNTGSRKDLKIYMLRKDSIHIQGYKPEILNFSFADQTDFSSSQFTDFDCEAMAAVGDTLYIFSKSKASGVCRIYKTAAIAGSAKIAVFDTLQFPFWATGAAYSGNRLYVVGYSPNWDMSLNPWLYTTDMVNGKINHKGARVYPLSVTGSKQTEAVNVGLKGKLYVSAEAYRQDSATMYEVTLPAAKAYSVIYRSDILKPNPVISEAYYTGPDAFCTYTLFNSGGIKMMQGEFSENKRLDLGLLGSGIYLLKTEGVSGCRFVRIVKL